MDFDEILGSAAFWILMGVGYGAFIIMLLILKAMGQKEIMPLWVKIITLILIPVIAALWSSWAEG